MCLFIEIDMYFLEMSIKLKCNSYQAFKTIQTRCFRHEIRIVQDSDSTGSLNCDKKTRQLMIRIFSPFQCSKVLSYSTNSVSYLWLRNYTQVEFSLCLPTDTWIFLTASIVTLLATVSLSICNRGIWSRKLRVKQKTMNNRKSNWRER